MGSGRADLAYDLADGRWWWQGLVVVMVTAVVEVGEEAKSRR